MHRCALHISLLSLLNPLDWHVVVHMDLRVVPVGLNGKVFHSLRNNVQKVWRREQQKVSVGWAQVMSDGIYCQIQSTVLTVFICLLGLVFFDWWFLLLCHHEFEKCNNDTCPVLLLTVPHIKNYLKYSRIENYLNCSNIKEYLKCSNIKNCLKCSNLKNYLKGNNTEN